MANTRVPRVATGIEGLDDILHGGLTADRLYLIEGMPGSGKTTLAFQFLLEGVRRGEPVLYLTLSETKAEVDGVAESHGWSLEGVTVSELMPSEAALEPGEQYTMFHPSEVELSETTRRILAEVERVKPTRVVFDSLSELRLLSGNPLRYRRQILALKQFFAGRHSTVLLLDDLTVDRARSAGPEHRPRRAAPRAHGAAFRRRAPAAERRPSSAAAIFAAVTTTTSIRRGASTSFRGSIAAEHRRASSRERIKSGLAELDTMLGGGLERGTSTLIQGAAGTGSRRSRRCSPRARPRDGEYAALFIFDESANTLFSRARGLQHRPLKEHVDDGPDPGAAGRSGRAFAGRVRARDPQCVEKRQAQLVVIDSLNGYLNSMPDEKFLIVQLHELLTYLGQAGVATVLIAAQQGLIGGQMSNASRCELSRRRRLAAALLRGRR